MKPITYFIALLSVVPLAIARNSTAFKLRVPLDGPAEVAGQYIIKNTTIPESPFIGFGFGEPLESILHLRIKPTNSSSNLLVGEVIDAVVTNVTVPLWLRPTHGTPYYFVRYGGNPLDDEVPALVMYKDWTVNEGRCASPNSPSCPERAGRWTLDYGPYPNWVACGNGDGHYAVYYYGTRRGCTETFDMEVVWD